MSNNLPTDPQAPGSPPETGNSARKKILAAMMGESSELRNGPKAGFAGKTALFLGDDSPLANHGQREIARAMEQEGIDKNDIWRGTGWGRRASGDWAFETDDRRFAVTPQGAEALGRARATSKPQSLPIWSAFAHPQLEQAYGDRWKDATATFAPSQSGEKASADETGIALDPRHLPTPGLAALGGIHELQHLDVARSNRPQAEFGDYHALDGEVEARNVQRRMKWTPQQRRDTPPWETEDVPREKQFTANGKPPPGPFLDRVRGEVGRLAAQAGIHPRSPLPELMRAAWSRRPTDEVAGWLTLLSRSHDVPPPWLFPDAEAQRLEAIKQQPTEPPPEFNRPRGSAFEG